MLILLPYTQLLIISPQDPSVTPILLDSFLDNNGYYVEDNIMWAAVENYASTDFTLMDVNLDFDSLATLKEKLDAGYYVILNIYSGSHWVLVFDYENSGTAYSDFILHDPGIDGADDRLAESDDPAKMTTCRPD